MNKIVSILGNGEKQWSCEFSPYNLSSKTKQNKKMKKTDKQSNLLSLTVSCEKRSCLSEVKTTQNKAKQHQQQKKTEKLMKIIVEAIIVIIMTNIKTKRK